MSQPEVHHPRYTSAIACHTALTTEMSLPHCTHKYKIFTVGEDSQLVRIIYDAHQEGRTESNR
jgi:hypothetical protein